MPRPLSLALASIVFLSAPAAAEPFEAPALVRSKARLELRSTLSLPIAKAPLTDGARFAKGDLLVSFDCRTLSAERAASRAAAKAARIDVTAKTRLVAHGAAGSDELRRARALHVQATSQTDAIGARMRACELKAPFAGRVVHVSARRAEVPEAGAPVITIIDDRRLDIEIVAPSKWLAWIEPGAPFSFEIEETGRTLDGHLTAIGSEVDPVSRTVRLFGAIEPGGRVLPGMSGRATFHTAR